METHTWGVMKTAFRINSENKPKRLGVTEQEKTVAACLASCSFISHNHPVLPAIIATDSKGSRPGKRERENG